MPLEGAEGKSPALNTGKRLGSLLRALKRFQRERLGSLLRALKHFQKDWKRFLFFLLLVSKKPPREQRRPLERSRMPPKGEKGKSPALNKGKGLEAS